MVYFEDDVFSFYIDHIFGNIGNAVPLCVTDGTCDSGRADESGKSMYLI